MIYSGNVKNPMASLTEGINTYRIVPVTLSNRDADEVFQKIRNRMKKGGALQREDLIPLALTPLMGGTSPVKDRIKEAFLILKKEEDTKEDTKYEETGKLQAMLYAFASKFLKKQELEEIKEVVGMTLLGEMLMEEGIKRGRQQGLERGMEQGIEQGTEKVNRLIQLLLKQGRMNDIEKAVRDREYQEKLFREFGL